MLPALAIAIPVGLFELAVILLVVVVHRAMRAEERARYEVEKQSTAAHEPGFPAARAA